MTRGKFAAWAALAACAVSAALAGAGVVYLSHPQGAEAADSVSLRVVEGSSARDVANLLEEKGVVGPAWLMGAAMRLYGVQRHLKAGEYLFRLPVSPAKVIDVLSRGRIVSVPVTIPEGSDLWETAALLAERRIAGKEELLAAFEDPSLIRQVDAKAETLEGFLFPETYRFPREYEATRVAQELVETFLRRFYQARREQLEVSALDLHSIVTLASLVEKETASASERPLIAGVFLTRLARGMLLQCDPTVIYALKLDGHWRGNIRRGDLRRKHPYNTYVSKGLPPGPIASPGLESLDAVLEPAMTGDLYFVSRGDGTHEFSHTLAEHQRAVRRFQLHRRRRDSP